MLPDSSVVLRRPRRAGVDDEEHDVNLAIVTRRRPWPLLGSLSSFSRWSPIVAAGVRRPLHFGAGSCTEIAYSAIATPLATAGLVQAARQVYLLRP